MAGRMAGAGKPGRDAKPPERAAAGGASMSKGQLAYEQRRATEAGLSLDAWLKRKAKEAEAAAPKVVTARAPARKGLIGRLLDKAHKPL